MKTNEKDSYGITVKSDYGRSILPENIIDIGRYDVTIEENGNIEGGVLCTNITAKTPFNISGSVLAMDTIKVTADKGTGAFYGPVNATRSFLVESKDTNVTACRILGDISGNSITLNNCVVYGNVLGNKVILKNCIILGDIQSSSYLELANSFAFSFISDQVKISEPSYILNFSSRFSEITLDAALYTLAASSLDAFDRDTLVELTKDDIIHSSEAELEEVTSIISCFNRITDLESIQLQIQNSIRLLENALISFVSTQDVDIAIETEKILKNIMK